MPPSKSSCTWKVLSLENGISDDPTHPLRIALRTYSLCLFLSLSPALLPAMFAVAVQPKCFMARLRVIWSALLRELRPTGFASAITAAVGGGAALQRLWHILQRHNTRLSACQSSFLANVISSTLGFILLRWKTYRRPGTISPTLDLSLLFFVRALDALVQTILLRNARGIAAREVQTSSSEAASRSVSYTSPVLDKQSERLAREWKDKVTIHLDTLVFWASSARIMWCFFYQPQRLSPSFVKWIGSLANVDSRLLQVLCAIRDGTWSYTRASSAKRDIATTLAEELGRSSSWADPSVLPAYGGNVANETWKQLGVDGRGGIGGIPCELVHGGIGATLGLQHDCFANAGIRAVHAFAQALVLHLPVNFLPILFVQPSAIMHPQRTLSALLSAIRSATFLSTFVSSCWFAVCFTRTIVLARVFPWISHDVWDGPYGGTLAGSLVCGASIWIESARRRREVTLYILPRALRALVPEKWLRSGHSVAHFAECLTFILSLASLLTFAVHQPESLRGLSRWTLAFVMRRPNVGFWKKIATGPPTHVDMDPNNLPPTDYHED